MTQQEYIEKMLHTEKMITPNDIESYAEKKGYDFPADKKLGVSAFCMSEFRKITSETVRKMDAIIPDDFKKDDPLTEDQMEEVKKIAEEYNIAVNQINSKAFDLVDVLCGPKATNDKEFGNGLKEIADIFGYGFHTIDDFFITMFGYPSPDEYLPEEYIGTEEYKKRRQGTSKTEEETKTFRQQLSEELLEYLEANQPCEIPDAIDSHTLMEKANELKIPVEPWHILALSLLTKESVDRFIEEANKDLDEIIEMEERISKNLSTREELEMFKNAHKTALMIHEKARDFVNELNKIAVRSLDHLAEGVSPEEFKKKITEEFVEPRLKERAREKSSKKKKAPTKENKKSETQKKLDQLINNL